MTELPAVTSSEVSFDDALLIAERCFGDLGHKTVFLWQQYNDDYFGGALDVTPILYVPTSPYGHLVGCTILDRYIYLMFPGEKRPWPYVRGVLLHEMIHQYLRQGGRDTKHAGQPWRDEIMRISKLLGKSVWAGRYTVLQGRRANLPPPSEFRGQVLPQKEIATWPDTIGVDLPDSRHRSTR